MKTENVIEVKNVTKSFKVFLDKGRTLKEKTLFLSRRKYEIRKVLDDISFEVKKGEAIGLIGHNGCGKSTTLKLLTRIMYPDDGTIEMQGRVSSLIELGAGFHPDMSGRQNIYTNASIFGLTRKEIDARLEDIIAFSELEAFIDNPVRTYSSGMYMRLAFAVAINVDADILLIDEILAVGDANFQAKCFDWLRELKAKGVTIVLVSHDTGTVERFCDKAAWINEGKIVIYDKASRVVDAYLSYMSGKRIESLIHGDEQSRENDEKRDMSETEPVIDMNSNHFGLGYIEIENARLTNAEGVETRVLQSDTDYVIEIQYKVNKPLDKYIFGMGIYSLDGVCIMGNNTQIDRIEVPHTKMKGTVKCKLPNLQLLSGKYILNVAIVDENNTPMDFYRDYCHFDVISPDKSIGFIDLEHTWIID